MVTLEQIKLLESKISRAIEFVGQVTEENLRLKQQNEELEETIATLKEETIRMEEGIASALGKFNQFEDAIERSLSTARIGVDQVSSQQVQPPAVTKPSVTAEPSADPEPPELAAPPPDPEIAKPSALYPPESTTIASAYTIDEEDEETEETMEDMEATEEDTWEKPEDSGEAELDIF